MFYPSLPPYVNANVYVDDFMLYSSSPIPRTIERRLQLSLNTLGTWCEETGFTFSSAKTVCMHICKRHNCPKMAHNLNLFNTPLLCVDHYKYLGMTLDNSITWKRHIDRLRASCYSTINLLKTLSHKRWGADRASLLRLYIMLLKPKLDYGCEIYASAAQSHLNKLTPIHNTAIRIATGAFRTSPLVSLYAESGIKPLTTYRNIKLLNTFARIYTNPRHPLHSSANHIIELTNRNPNDVPPLPRRMHFFHRMYALINSLPFNFTDLLMEVPSTSPMWCIPGLTHCTDLFTIPKSSLTPAQFKRLFEQHATQHQNTLQLFTDGSKSNNSVSFAFLHNEIEFSRRIQPIASAFTAELYAIYKSLDYALTNPNPNQVTIFSDKGSAIQCINKYPCTNPLAQLIRCHIESLDRPVCFCWVPSHIGVPGNERVDGVARAASNSAEQPVELPRSDIKSYIKRCTTEQWSLSWRSMDPLSNKYRSVSNSIRPFDDANCPNRLWSVILCRLRLGHTQPTHGYLLSRDPPPHCMDCIVPLTVYHSIIECPSYSDERRNCFGLGPHALDRILSPPTTALNGPLHRFLLTN